MRASVFGASALSVASGAVAGADARNVPTGAAETAIEAMNKAFYNTTDGRWDTNAPWWLSGVALQTLLDYMLITSSRDYLEQAQNTVELQKAPLEWWPEGDGYFRADSTDDTAWWGQAMLSLYDLTNSTNYLDIAILDEEYIWSYWINSTCSGGVIWDIPSLEYKNAISNEQYIKLAASLHNRIPGDERYLQRALQAWEWFEGSGMINADKLVNDGLAENASGECRNNNQTTWTYNQGMILGGLVELSRATDDKGYLEAAREIADAVIASEELSPDGILTEPCSPGEGCSSDQTSFKGIFAKNLAELDNALEGQPYKEYLVQNAESAWKKARNETNDLYGVSWTGPLGEATVGSQISAVNLLLYTM
ncbi:putative mannan endo-1,6-alpha-mannosidase -like protein [Hapsidospora chrysogenum ATCC 11550]|uniref:Putative mannan endo-1,6-alpha-mannosidase-like protein n=1 Tax=Hapsidospora chrysogenum (strain ATCC 11550 / CBS 779.69 / DSM 880 / IAM 14645 / JCM 23072 / IMI 49137) TaxID=857340 RepID=A0A086TEF1_HAPC1|nr:putative mannan endo-1,6-alpha-mannosidase -like protein [Hapsidospora chrysogenum ATCC 11550]